MGEGGGAEIKSEEYDGNYMYIINIIIVTNKYKGIPHRIALLERTHSFTV